MFRRLVDQYVVQDLSGLLESVWGDVLPIRLSADFRLGNLECVISANGIKWNPLSKPFHFLASPRAIEILRSATFDCVTLANNHVLDYGPEALLDCLDRLRQDNFPYTGAGTILIEALTPAFLQLSNFNIAVLALTDNEPKWEATPSNPGINYVAYNERGLLPPYRERIAKAIQQARQPLKWWWSVLMSAPTEVLLPMRSGRWLTTVLIWEGMYTGDIPTTPLKVSKLRGKSYSVFHGRFCR